MAPLPVINDTYRITLLWQGFSGVMPRNVFHVSSTSNDVSDIAGVISDAFGVSGVGNNMFWPMHSSQSCASFDILPLDGTTAGSTWPIANPLEGAAVGETIPASSYVVSMKTGVRGPSGRGRMYIGPIRETAQDGGVTDPTGQGNVLAGFGNFQNELQGSTPVVTLVVASYKEAVAHTVTSFRVNTACGTQRRRQDQVSH
jgi:hypothetical protein